MSVIRDGGQVSVEMTGWAFPDPELAELSPSNFNLNGKPFMKVFYPLDRAEVGIVFWQRENARFSGFRCLAKGTYDEIYRDGVLEVTYVNPGPPRRVPAQQSWYWCDPEREGEFPHEDQRYRVIGNKDLDGFVLTGLTDFRRLDAAVSSVAGKGMARFRRILDWGCGCGRVARHTARLPNVEFTGCDIDVQNVLWCANNLKGSFVATALNPPLPFPDASFDLIYGISVFTHQREAMQDSWLAELERVTAPGGVLLMTTHGQTALDYAGLKPDEYPVVEQRIAEHGLYVSSGNTQIDGHADHEGEYVNVFHSLQYLRDHWGARFEILAVLPGYIYTHDLVVMRRRKLPGRFNPLRTLKSAFASPDQ
ncbi:MAG: class I SAM-dependent methyltransferase [Casimicrobiaceae bacterium]